MEIKETRKKEEKRFGNKNIHSHKQKEILAINQKHKYKTIKEEIQKNKQIKY